MRLSGRHGIVTGGGSGIGRAIALSAAREGARVLICGRRKAPLDETAALARAGGGAISVLPCDLTLPVSIERIAQEARGWDGVHFLVNNAGISGASFLHEPGSDELWDRILLTNLTAPYRLCRALIPLMGKGGRIVNISSVLGKFGVPGYSAYCSSKHGIVGLTRALAMELAEKGITVNCICPGWVETEMAASGMATGARKGGVSPSQFREEALSRVPIGRMLEPEEIAPLALYLLSDESAGMTGQSINLCGGQTTA